MDPRLLDFYLQELSHVRDSAAEFAARFPKVASRLGMDSTEVSDPYVERLLEGFAFLTARIQLRLNDEFPRFTEQLLDHVAPLVLAPVPSMGVVQFNTAPTDPALRRGVAVPAGLECQSQVAKGQQTPCRFRTAHAITLWPVQIKNIVHGPFAHELPGANPTALQARSAMQIELQTTGQIPFSSLAMDHLDFYVAAGDELAFRLFDRLVYHQLAVCVRTAPGGAWQTLNTGALKAIGFDQTEALLPDRENQFSGLRLLQEFYACPSRFLFFRVGGLRKYVSSNPNHRLELAICFAHPHTEFDRMVQADSLALHCVPVVNLFDHDCDRVVIDPQLHELHVVPKRTQPLDYEVHSILAVKAHGTSASSAVLPLHQAPAALALDCPRYSVHRVPSRLSDKQVREGARSSYQGSEVYLGLSQTHLQLQQGKHFQQLAVRAQCTNRDLPLLMPLGQGPTDLQWPGHLPLKSIRFVRNPSRPRTSPVKGQSAWHLVEHLSSNYLGLIPKDGSDSARTLTQLLGLFADPSTPGQLEASRAVHSVHAEPTACRRVVHGRPAVLRGLSVQIELNEEALAGLGLGVFGAVLAQYLARHVSVNSFVAVRVRGMQSARTIEFEPLAGNRPLL